MVLLFISDSQEFSFRVDGYLNPVTGGYSPSEYFKYILFSVRSQQIDSNGLQIDSLSKENVSDNDINPNVNQVQSTKPFE